METEFRIIISSDLDFEDLVAEVDFVNCKESFPLIATITMEEGVDKMGIILHFLRGRKIFDFKLDKFLLMIKKTKDCLYGFRRLEPSNDIFEDYYNPRIPTDTDFTFTISSGVKFEEFIAIIKANDSKLAVLTQEEGFENVRIQLYPPKKKKFWFLRLDNFLSIIEQAKAGLYNFRKT